MTKMKTGIPLVLTLLLALLRDCHSTVADLYDVFACFNRVLQLSCDPDYMIVLESAQYGRNNTHVARICGSLYQRTCDVDVHFIMNRMCAGKTTCTLSVNTTTFGDPCGWEEFLMVTYKCVEVQTIKRSCNDETGPVYYERGYISSPNYPVKYYMDANCFWRISVQSRQTIRIYILDFELDVKKRGNCYDFLEISANDAVYFKDCGALGRQELQIPASEAVVQFSTATNTMAERGFMLYFEAVGPGCPDLDRVENADVFYYMELDVLFANVTCDDPYVIAGKDVDTLILRCSGSHWDTARPICTVHKTSTSPVSVILPGLPSLPPSDHTPLLERPESLVGIALGVLSAVLLITLLLVLALYFHRRRRNAERKLDQWRVVINNLQENANNEENLKRSTLEYDYQGDCKVDIVGASNTSKKARKKRNNQMACNSREDVLQGHNLLTSHYYDEDDPEYVDFKEDTYTKYVDEGDLSECYHCGSRRNSRSSKHGMLNRDDDSGMVDNQSQRRSRRDVRCKRTRSGYWEPARSQSTRPEVTEVTQMVHSTSAPDLLALDTERGALANERSFHRESSFPTSPTSPAPHTPRCATPARTHTSPGSPSPRCTTPARTHKTTRSTTLPPSGRTARPTRSNSKPRIRC